MGSMMLAVGLMSGTSRDGIDAALICTDGADRVEPIGFHALPYDEDMRQRLAGACAAALSLTSPRADPRIDPVASELDRLHARAVAALLARNDVASESVSVIGYHGHTVAHRPDRGWTWQIGSGAALAAMTGIDVVDDLRSDDVRAGGQGAPLIPVYHRALLGRFERPIAVLNLGGVANVTWIGEGDALVAFDTGMASALIDDWMQEQAGQPYDAGGACAATGQVNEGILTAFMDHPYFELPPPKSLDRDDFTLVAARGLSLADGAATLTAFSAEAFARGLRLCPSLPERMVVAGGGRHNATLMRMIEQRAGVRVLPIDDLGWDGDAIEAQGFAYMAARTLQGLPISFPGTTGAPRPMSGGHLNRASARALPEDPKIRDAG